MPLAIAIGVAGIAGAGASLIGAHDASSAASNAAAANNALQEQIYNSNKGLETPFITSGDNAETELNGFLGLGGDPKATQAAFQKYLDSTGYQFNLDQGMGAVTNSKAASGLLGSGSLVKSLDAFGTGLADQYGQQYVGNLQNEVSTGANSANALAGQGQSYANAVSGNNNSAAAASGNADLAAANSFNSLLGNAFSAYGLSRGGSSFGGGTSGGNAFAPGLNVGG
ncbi:MAG TPA: hypothetical protein VG166_09215 [Caulobacteraceae bacterium]|jgi:hypothetical protein|nr:hypothetical protein [Caulobacteraceae bacterium]